MLFSSTSSIEEHIISILGAGSIRTTGLILKVNEVRPNTTKQAIYAALRNLCQQEVVIAHGMRTSLNVRWLNSLEKYLNTAVDRYHFGQTDKGSFQYMKDKEKIEYHFNDLLETDAFWWQALYQFINFSTTDEPVYIYNPHEWFLIARKESELEVFETIKSKGKQLLLTSGANTTLDKYIANEFNGEDSQYFMSPKALFLKNNYYLNVVDDYLIEVWISQSVADDVDKIYSKFTTNIELVESKFAEILKAKNKGRLVIRRNKNKADKLKKLLGKHFYIKK